MTYNTLSFTLSYSLSFSLYLSLRVWIPLANPYLRVWIPFGYYVKSSIFTISYLLKPL